MEEQTQKDKRRKRERRKLLTEHEFRRLIEDGKTFDGDRRSWKERRKNASSKSSKDHVRKELKA